MESMEPTFRPTTAPASSPLEAVVHELCRYIEAHADETLALSDLASRAGYSPAHLQKAFTALVGSSPKAYQKAWRLRRLKANLRDGAELLPAVLGAGFGSPSRVYEDLPRTLGMTPGQYQKGAAPLVIRWAVTTTPLGLMALGATPLGLCFLQFGDTVEALRAMLEAEFPRARLEPMPPEARPLFTQWEAALAAFFAGKASLATLPLDLRGTAFQIAVWRFLQSIPSGQTATYSQVAAGVGRPRAVRAVAAACAHNRIALAVPCHRVIRGDGNLAGYRWGLDRKSRLLNLEVRPPGEA